MPGDPREQAQRAVVGTFERALRREAHNLSRRPDLVWQQLYNRLQWSEGRALELAEREADRRAADPHGQIWFRTRTPFRESGALLTTLRHPGVVDCALAASGVLLSSCGGGSLRLWDAHTGVELARVDDLDDPVVSCAFDCEGRFLVTEIHDGRVHIRDGETLAELAELHVGAGARAHSATSPVEPVAAIASGSALRVVELPSGRERAAASVKGGAFTCCALSNDGEQIVTGDDQGTLRLWSADTLDEQMRMGGDWPGGIEACVLSPSAAFVAVVLDGSTAVLLVGGPDETGRPRTTTLPFFDRVNDCCVSPDGRWLASVGDDHLTWLAELEDLTRPMSVLEGHNARVVRCTFAANGSLLATASDDGTVKLWDPWEGPSRGGISGHRERVTALAFAPDGSFVVSASADLTLKTWDPAPTAERSTLEGHTGPVWDCVVLKGSGLVASAAGDGTLRLWDVASGRETRAIQVGLMADVHALACSPDGYLLAVGHDRSVSLWELATGEQASEAEVEEAGPHGLDRRVQDCTFTSDGGRVLLACEDGTLRVWDVATWSELTVLRGHTDSVSCCAAVPASSFAVSGGKDGTLRLWDLDSGRNLHVFTGHRDAIWDLAVSADAAVVASVGWDGALRLWDLAGRAPVATFSVPERLRSVALDRSKQRVAFGDTDGWVRVVDVMGLRRHPSGLPSEGR